VCVEGNTARQKRRDLFGTVRTDARTVIPQLQRFLDGGASKQAIAEAAGCGYTTIRLILNGTRKTVQQPTRDRIMRLSGAALMGFVPSVGSVRRVQSLMAAKHPLAAVTHASGLNHATVSDLLNGRHELVRGTTAAAIRKAYTELSGHDGTSVRSAARAARMGWAPPAAWDEDAIDDAAAFPNWTGLCGTVKGFRRHVEQDIPACARCITAEESLRGKKLGRAA
jgi:hypothetical protein